MNRDSIAGTVFLIIGATALFNVHGLKLGSASRMGPGYFPTVLGSLLFLLGLAILLSGIRKGGPGWTWARPRSYFVLLAVVLFAVFLGWGSFLFAMIALMGVGSLAALDLTPRAALVSGAVITLACYAIFVWGLGVNLPMWPL